MRKYPVHGKNGEEYLIKISPSILEGMVKAVLYKKVNIFGIVFNKKLRWNTYNAEEYNYNYIHMSKRQVILYEESISREFEGEVLHNTELEKFEAWDGKL